MGTFFDVVTNELTTETSKDELLLQLAEIKVENEDLELKLKDMLSYKDRFEALEKDAGPDYAKCVAQKTKEVDKQKNFAKQYRLDLDIYRKQVDVYEKFIAGQFDQIDCEMYIGKIKQGMNPFGVKLRKIKVSTIRKNKTNSPTANRSIADL